MIVKSSGILLIGFLLISFLSCSKNEDKQAPETKQITELPEDGIEIRDARASPGRMNGVSAIYMTVLNGASLADSIVSVSSPVAGLAEVHESYKQEEGMMGMRQAESVIIPARDLLRLEPGGMHVMLMQLKNRLENDDEVELIIRFENAGEIVVKAPVQPME